MMKPTNWTISGVGGDVGGRATGGDPGKYLLLSTSRTGTMEEELNAAGARGYRVAGALRWRANQ